MPAGRPRSGALTPREWVERLAWAGVQRARRTADVLGGLRRAEQRAARWQRAWIDRWGNESLPAAAWLARPGAGRLWLAPDDAATWAREGCAPADLALAEAAAEDRFDLLASGPVSLRGRLTFRHDLYTGEEWELVPWHRVQLRRGGGTDVRTLWELSRCYHFVALARAHWTTGDTRFRDAFVRHVRAWIAGNPAGRGPQWATPMDLAIRAANWSLAVVLFAGVPGIPAELWGELLANLRLTTWFVARHPEWHPVFRGNHYVSNAVGMVYVGALFRDDAQGARWLRAGARMLEREIAFQVAGDGVAMESALAYHRLDTELFAWAGEVLRQQPDMSPSAAYEGRLRAMYSFIAAYLPPGGEAPMLGDADDGRLHVLNARDLEEPRRHARGLPERHWPSTSAASAAFRDGGFYVVRRGLDHLVVRCGAVGLRGAGSHDHNDQLSFELVIGGHRVVADSGTYAYGKDLAARHRFRTTAYHSVVQLGDAEQNPITESSPWRVLADRTQARCTEWRDTPAGTLFQGEHAGYGSRPSGAVCRRRIVAEGTPTRWEIVDEVAGQGTESLTWRLLLAAGQLERLPTEDGDCAFQFTPPDGQPVRLALELPPGLDLAIASTRNPASDRYGEMYERPGIAVHGTVALPFRMRLLVTADEALALAAPHAEPGVARARS